MSKVKRLRKKYRVFCSNAKKISDSQVNNLNPDQVEKSMTKSSDFSRENGIKNQVNALYDMIIDAKDNRNVESDLRSNYSLAKSIKTSFSGQSILKKDKRRLKHQLFLRKLESSAEMMQQLKKSKPHKDKKIDLYDDLPSLLIDEKHHKSSNPKFKSLKTPMKNRNIGKGLTKRRNAQMKKDIEQFQKLLNKETTGVNQFEEIQRRIVDRLSKEALESTNAS